MTSHRNWAQTINLFAEGVAKNLEIEEADTPSPAQFAAFVNLGFCPFQSRFDAAVRLSRIRILLGEMETLDWPLDLLSDLDDDELLQQIPEGHLVIISRITMDGILEGTSLNFEDEVRVSVLELEHARMQIPPDSRPRSFLVPLMEAWLKHPGPRPSDPVQHRYPILPDSINHAVSARAKLPPPEVAELPRLGQQPTRGPYLPGLEPPPGVVVPVLPLRVAEESTSGRSAPITPRLWFGFQLALALHDRTGQNQVLPFTLQEICAWLWPNGWNRGRDLPRLIAGLRNLTTMGIVWERREWLLVRPLLIPTMDTKMDDYLMVEITALPGSDRGAMIDSKALWELGARGAVPWRIWIRLAYLWDQVKTRNGGFRVYATRPEVHRGPSGVILDKKGAPVLRKDGKPVLDWSDPRAVRTGRQERHPQADRVPSLRPSDQVLLGFDQSPVSAVTLRGRAKNSREWLTKMEGRNLVVLEWDGHHVRVLEPYRPSDTERNAG